MATDRDRLVLTYHELIQFANKVITESPEATNATEATKKLASHMFRELFFRIYSKLFQIHNHILSPQEIEIFEQSIKALFINTHTRFDTKPFSDIIERPWSI